MRVERRYVEILAEYVETKFTAECARLASYKKGLVVSRSKQWETQVDALGLDPVKFRRHVSKNQRVVFFFLTEYSYLVFAF
jgi:hypothetical protein